MPANEFVNWIHPFWNSIIEKQPHPKLNECLNKILHRISASGSAFEKSSIEDWMEILENELIQEEFHILSRQDQGVELLSVNAITSLRAKQAFLIGLDHHSCHQAPRTFFERTRRQTNPAGLRFSLPRSRFQSKRVRNYSFFKFI